LRSLLVKLTCLSVGVIGVICLSKNDRMNLIVKEWYGQLN